MKRLKEAGFVVATSASPSSLHACAVCFGAGDNPALPKAFTWGILLLLAFTFSILGSLVLAVYRIEARRNAQSDEP